MSELLSEDQINQIVTNNKLPCNVRYAMLRQTICEHAPNKETKHTLLEMVGQQLGGELVKGRPIYWLFKDGKKAKFDLENQKPVTRMAQAFMEALKK